MTDDDSEYHATSPTGRVCDELALHGYRPGRDEHDPRPLPDIDTARRQVEAVFEAHAAMLTGTCLEPDLEPVLWSAVNDYHRRVARIERELDANEAAQRRSQRHQDGSEIQSVELETLIAQGQLLVERRNFFELLRDYAAEQFEAVTGSAWRPHSGSTVNHATMTASMIDSKDFLEAERRAKAELLLPKGTPIAFTGGVDYNDHQRIWKVLDKLRERYPDMVLMHGGARTGADSIAALWARERNVVQVAFKPDFTRDGRRAGFLRNDKMLAGGPAAVVVFPGSGISLNLRDKARKNGIAVWDLSGAADPDRRTLPSESAGSERICKRPAQVGEKGPRTYQI